MKFLPKILEYKLPKNGLKVLDVGYGEGRDAIKLAEFGCLVDAVDPKGAKIDNPNIKLFNVPVENFDLPENKYDLVIAQNVLFFTESPIQTAKKLLDSCKKGGMLCITLLGTEDAWCGKEKVFCVEKKEIQEFKNKLIGDGNEIIFEQEELGLGATMAGDTKKWHIFSLMVKRG
jgi:SAM-dependent methyltransferase